MTWKCFIDQICFRFPAPSYEDSREAHERLPAELERQESMSRIFTFMCFRALCCKGPPLPRPEYDVVCIGLTGAGKTSLLSRLCSEGSEGIVPTTGFSIKAVPFPNAILNVKELGGADNIKKYWSRYYQGSQGVVFVLDSASSDEDLEAARNELHSALQHPQLCTLPFLILANHQDKPAARTPNQLSFCNTYICFTRFVMVIMGVAMPVCAYYHLTHGCFTSVFSDSKLWLSLRLDNQDNYTKKQNGRQ
ncbi:hypothetical protein PAMP_021995 [Pampus punctatissimus]